MDNAPTSAPDRASGVILVDLKKALTHAKKDQARLVLVDFAEAQGWRRHGPLWQRLAEEDVEVLSPATLTIKGKAFDPRDHSGLGAKWRLPMADRSPSTAS